MDYKEKTLEMLEETLHPDYVTHYDTVIGSMRNKLKSLPSEEEITKRIREKYLDVFTKDISFLRKDHEIFCIWLKDQQEAEE